MLYLIFSSKNTSENLIFCALGDFLILTSISIIIYRVLTIHTSFLHLKYLILLTAVNFSLFEFFCLFSYHLCSSRAEIYKIIVRCAKKISYYIEHTYINSIHIYKHLYNTYLYRMFGKLSRKQKKLKPTQRKVTNLCKYIILLFIFLKFFIHQIQ